MDLLLIEMVPMAHRLASELATGHEGTKPMDDDEKREAALRRLETLGYRVGQGLVERCGRTMLKNVCMLMIGCTNRFSRDRPRFSETLDVIKFLCKDMWTLVFRKQIDNLKTNHRVWILYPLLSGLNMWDLLINGSAGCLRSHR